MRLCVCGEVCQRVCEYTHNQGPKISHTLRVRVGRLAQAVITLPNLELIIQQLLSMRTSRDTYVHVRNVVKVPCRRLQRSSAADSINDAQAQSIIKSDLF